MASNKCQNRKRLIVCCDGTWMNSDTGYEKPSFFNPIGRLQTPSNVTRIARAFRRRCTDGTVQIVNYQCGVGTGSTWSDILTGGAFGRGVAEHIREAYSYICANYVDGDEIVLVGFSRGAFTARSVAGMIADLGLLTREGMEFYYPIFKDMENWRTPKYKDPFPDMPFPDKPHGENAEDTYRQRLVENGLTRVYQDDGSGLIKVKAVAVWDTVGSLGIPKIDILARLGLKNSTKEFNFYDTALSDRIEHAFHALALDESRPPFRPTVWERRPENKDTTDLRQVWFPGNHGNVGGGWADQGIANLSLAWMMDQLGSIGIEFDEVTIDRIFTRARAYYHQEATLVATRKIKPPHRSRRHRLGGPEGNAVAAAFFHGGGGRPKWAVEPLYGNNAPARPWGLAAIQEVGGFLYRLAGRRARRPGRYRRIDPRTGSATAAFLEDTNERVHASVRVRLAVSGLGLNDSGFWDCPALLNRWTLRQVPVARDEGRECGFDDPVPLGTRKWGPHADGLVTCVHGEMEHDDDDDGEGGGCRRPPSPGAADTTTRWVWDYVGPERDAPPVRRLVEEVLGPYERHLLKLSGGEPNVFRFAEGRTFVPEALGRKPEMDFC